MCADVASSGKGSRNDTLARAAYSLGQIGAVAGLSDDTLEAALMAVAPTDRTFPTSEARLVIRSGLRKGRTKPRTISDTMHIPAVTWQPPTAPQRPPEQPKYPPQEEVAELRLNMLSLASEVEPWPHDARLYLESRFPAVDDLCDTITSLQLARMIHPETPCPEWAGLGTGDHWRSWGQLGYCLAVGLWDSSGNLRSVKVRLTGVKPWDTAPKTLDPTGYNVKGLVMANVPARRILASEQVEPTTIVIAEGVTDWLVASVQWPARPVIGVDSGLWTADHARRVVDGSTIIIRTDNDPSGDKYADSISATFKGRKVRLQRQQPVRKNND